MLLKTHVAKTLVKNGDPEMSFFFLDKRGGVQSSIFA